MQLLFGTNHRFYGAMDLMGLRNMHIPRIEASLQPSGNVSLTTAWLGFWLANTADSFYPESGEGRNQNGYGLHPGFSPYVGQEVDLLVSWRISKWNQFQAGYGHYFVGSYIRRSLGSAPATGGAADADWIYLQLNSNF
jgi:hypothetical protein